jgi:hypothetical protein
MSWPTATSFHESAHAVAALAIGLPLELASVIPDAESSGRVTLAKSTAAGGEPLSRAEKGLLHGLMAVFYFSGGAGGRLIGLETAVARDEENAAAFAATLDGVPPLMWTYAARHVAERIVQQNADAVARVASELLVARVLSAERVRELAGPLLAPDLRGLAAALDNAHAAAAREQRRAG